MRINIGGVPEHFNLPWSMALENHLFDDNNIDLNFAFYAGGTGAMTQALAKGELDMAILLTEGFISAVHQGLAAKLVKVYIDTPLVWGIFTGAQSGITHPFDKPKPQYAISRLGSGSHLMPMIHAFEHNLEIANEQLRVVHSLHSAIDTLVAGETDIFYWERFMAAPFEKQQLIRQIGIYTAPWSGFLIVASNDAIQTKRKEILTLCDLMSKEVERFKYNPLSIRVLANRFNMTTQEAEAWLSETIWNQGYKADLEALVNSRNALTRIGACSKQLKIEQFIADWVQLTS
jgi:hypothetical protein